MSKPDVYANGRSVVHAGDGLEHACAPPDTCNTPTPGGPPQPVPYLNVGKSGDLRGGSTSVKIAGNSIALAGAELSSTSGDEPGTLGGLVSGKNRGKAGWVPGVAGSENVFVEGKAIIRFLDPILHNGNTYNSAFQTPGETTAYAYADDFDGLCPICSQGPERHRIHEHESTVELANRLIRRLRDARQLRGSRVTYKGRGYMVGVMKCKCGQTWAATSGTKTTSGFVEVAGEVVDNVIESGPVSMEQMWAANKSRHSASGFNEFDETWKHVREQNKNGVPGFLPPGNCAGAKLLATGHLPVAMTERYLSGKTDWQANYQVRQTHLTASELAALSPAQRHMVLRNVLATIEPMSFSATRDWTQTVASCHTCQALLYMVMCEGDTRAC